MSRLRVLFLTPHPPAARPTSTDGRAGRLLRHLDRHARVALVSMVQDPAEEAVLERDIRAESVTVVRATRWRNRFHTAPTLLTRRPFTHAMLDSPGVEMALRDVVLQHGPDVVLARGTAVARFALLPALRSIPLVVDLAGLESAEWEERAASAPFAARWIHSREARCLERAEGEILLRARTTFVGDAFERDRLRRLSRYADIRVMPDGIEIERYRPFGPSTSEPRVIFFHDRAGGRPSEPTVLRLIRRIWPAVRASRADARLTIVSGSAPRRVARFARADSSIEIVAAADDVRPDLWRSAVMLGPLEKVSSVPRRVLEGLAAGLPVVVGCDTVAGVPEEALPGCVVAARDDSVAEAIIDLLSRSPLERAAMARTADLDRCGEERQLACLLPALDAAARRQPNIRLAS